MFREVVGQLFAEASGTSGDSLHLLLQEGWQVFPEPRTEADSDRQEELLLAILEYGLHPKDDVDLPDYRALFRRKADSPVELIERWDERVEELLENPAAFDSQGSTNLPQLDDPLSGFDFIADAVESAGLAYRTRKPHFRARIHKNRESPNLIPLSEMGAPPSEKATVGRANKAKVPVLYVASDPKTAVAEVRAWKGAVVAVAKMELPDSLRILNLVNLPAIGSPFGGESLAWLLEARELFRRFGEELSRPAIPGEEETDYAISQHICEIARTNGFDGIAYPSALGAGYNVALFDPAAAVPSSIEYLLVRQPSFPTAPYANKTMIWDPRDLFYST